VTSRQPPPVAARPTAPPPAPPARPGTALATLQTLPVKGRAPRTGYDRERFGQAWADVDRNGCDTRNDVLRRDLTSYVLKAGTHGCLVLRGTLHDPYTGRTISFLRGPSTSMDVQVDHVVALSDAWQKGAQSWDAGRRERFANDSLNLLAVDGPTNARKGDGDAATWLPPSTSYRCDYVARQVAVKHEYGLSMTPAEQASAARVLSRCPSHPLPEATAFTLGGGRVEAAASAPQPTPQPTSPPTHQPTHQPEAPVASGTDPDMGTCKAAKAAGYGPYYSGRDGEYGWYRDQDSDGVVCE
jgi:hypothetical protein